MSAHPARITVAPKRAISYSRARTLACWRAHHFQYVDGLRPRTRGVALRTGVAFDAFLNGYYAPGVDPAYRWAARADGIEHFDKDAVEWLAFHEQRGTTFYEPPATTIDAERQTLVAMMDQYVERWADEDAALTFTHRQLEIDTPLRASSGRASTRYQAHGFVDGLAMIDGDLWLWEDKTTGRLDAGFREHFHLNRQLRWYAWALRDMGFPIVGIVLNATLRATPKRPETTKDGKRLKSIVKADGTLAIQTTAKLVRGAIAEHGFDEADYADALEVLDADRDRWHYRDRIYLTDAEVDEAGREWHAISKFADQLPPVAMPDQMRCGMCAFKPICVDPGQPDLIHQLYTTPAERASLRLVEPTTIETATEPF